MEFKNQYLNYDEYEDLGGTLEETPFNVLEFEAQKNIDKYTFGRLINLDKQINEVKICVYRLIEILKTYNDYDNKNKAISSESIDGYSVSYGDVNESLIRAKEIQIKSIIKTCLAECKLEDGTPYLYCGGVGNDNKCNYNLL